MLCMTEQTHFCERPWNSTLPQVLRTIDNYGNDLSNVARAILRYIA